ncbi:MAG: hypothetical protein MMC33_000052 [Icmadophila ericetorum]|nr:hypothetical protein [Icmadophila ericetorum]
MSEQEKKTEKSQQSAGANTSGSAASGGINASSSEPKTEEKKKAPQRGKKGQSQHRKSEKKPTENGDKETDSHQSVAGTEGGDDADASTAASSPPPPRTQSKRRQSRGRGRSKKGVSDTESDRSDLSQNPTGGRRNRNRKKQQQQTKAKSGGGGGGPLEAVDEVGETVDGAGDVVQQTAGNMVNGVSDTAGKAVGGKGKKGGKKVRRKKGEGGDEDDDGKGEQLRLRLDLNLDIEIQLKAKIRGDLTLGLFQLLQRQCGRPFCKRFEISPSPRCLRAPANTSDTLKYFGYGPCQTLPSDVSLDELPPYLFHRDPIFICIDVEKHCREHTLTEIGVSWLDTRDFGRKSQSSHGRFRGKAVEISTLPRDKGSKWTAAAKQAHWVIIAFRDRYKLTINSKRGRDTTTLPQWVLSTLLHTFNGRWKRSQGSFDLSYGYSLTTFLASRSVSQTILTILDQPFRLLDEYCITLDPKKTFLNFPSATILGQQVDGFGLSTTEERVKANRRINFPKTFGDLIKERVHAKRDCRAHWHRGDVSFNRNTFLEDYLKAVGFMVCRLTKVPIRRWV